MPTDKITGSDSNSRHRYNSFLKKGEELIQQGKYDEALECYDNAISLYPDNKGGLINKGVTLLNLKRYGEALNCFDKVLTIESDDIALAGKGTALGGLNKYEEALGYFDAALKIRPNNDIALALKGNALLGLNRYDNALKCAEEALKINPSGNPNPAWTGTMNSGTELAWLVKGIVLINRGQYEEALKCFDNALEINSNNLDALIRRGAVLLELGRYEEAIKSCEDAIKIDQSSISAWIIKGNALVSLGHYEDAIERFDRVLKVDFNNVLALLGRANALVGLGSYQDAVELYNRILKIDPNNEYALEFKADAEISLSNKKSPKIPFQNKGYSTIWKWIGIALRTGWPGFLLLGAGIFIIIYASYMLLTYFLLESIILFIGIIILWSLWQWRKKDEKAFMQAIIFGLLLIFVVLYILLTNQGFGAIGYPLLAFLLFGEGIWFYLYNQFDTYKKQYAKTYAFREGLGILSGLGIGGFISFLLDGLVSSNFEILVLSILFLLVGIMAYLTRQSFKYVN